MNNKIHFHLNKWAEFTLCNLSLSMCEEIVHVHHHYWEAAHVRLGRQMCKNKQVCVEVLPGKTDQQKTPGASCHTDINAHTDTFKSCSMISQGRNLICFTMETEGGKRCLALGGLSYEPNHTHTQTRCSFTIKAKSDSFRLLSLPFALWNTYSSDMKCVENILTWYAMPDLHMWQNKHPVYLHCSLLSLIISKNQ